MNPLWINTAKILIEDDRLLLNWKEFCDLLEIPSAEILRLSNQLRVCNTTYYDLFKEILHIWTSRVGQEEASVERLQDILRAGKFVNVSDKLNKLSSKTLPKTSCQNHFGLKKCIPNFIGRKSELQTLRTWVENNEFLVTVTGMGGVGKSTLLQKFVNDALTSSDQIRIIWFQCGHESTLEESITKFANHLGISKNQSSSSSLQHFQSCIHSIIQDKTSVKTVLVFDNVDNIHANLLEILKFLNSLSSTTCSHPITSIVTSTLLPMTQYSGKSLTLGVLEEEEATQFLQTNLPPELTTDPENLKSLCKLVQNLPRTLQQAVDNIRQENLAGIRAYGVQDYVRDLTCGSPRRKRKLLDHPLSPIEHSDSDRTTTLNTWRLTMRNLNRFGIEGRWAIKLHKLLSYLDSEQTSIPALKKVINCATFFLVDGSKKVKLTDSVHDRFDKALKLLKEHHLIDIDVHEQTLSTHRMLKETTRIQIISPKSSQILSEVLGHVQYNLLNNGQPSHHLDENNNNNAFNNQETVPLDDEVTHILIDIWKQALKFPDLIERYAVVGVQSTSHSNCPLHLLSTTVEQMISMFPETYPLLVTAKIHYFSHKEMIEDEGMDLLKSLIAHSTVFLGPVHPEVVRARSILESVIKSRSRLSQFIQFAEDSLLLEDQISPLSSSPNSFNNGNRIEKFLQLGNAYEQRQEYDAAIEYYLGGLVWTRMIKEDGENCTKSKENDIIDKIKYCCGQAGKFIDEYFNFDDIPCWDNPSCLPNVKVEQEDTTSNDTNDSKQEKHNFKWRRFFKRFAHKVNQLDASKIRKIVQSLRLDMLPHR